MTFILQFKMQCQVFSENRDCKENLYIFEDMPCGETPGDMHSRRFYESAYTSLPITKTHRNENKKHQLIRTLSPKLTRYMGFP